MNTLYTDYENVLIGQLKEIPAYHFYGQDPTLSNERTAVELIRYAFENILGWEKDDIKKKLDTYMLTVMRLTKLLKYIEWPVEVKKGNLQYVLYLLYPDDFQMNPQELTVDTYLKILANETNFPKEYFIGTEGFYRYCICFKYAITNFKAFKSVEEIYLFFSSPAGNRFLVKYKIFTPVEILTIDVYDVIHAITEGMEYSDAYYVLYKLTKELKKDS